MDIQWSREDLAGLEDHYIESETTSYDELGVAKYYDLKWGDTVLKDAAWFYPEPKAVDGVETEILKDQVTFSECCLPQKRCNHAYCAQESVTSKDSRVSIGLEKLMEYT